MLVGSPQYNRVAPELPPPFNHARLVTSTSFQEVSAGFASGTIDCVMVTHDCVGLFSIITLSMDPNSSPVPTNTPPAVTEYQPVP